jgi:hypothetical protein
MKSVANIKVGDRLESDGHYATVRYVGKLPLADSSRVGDVVWIGVEWDESSRGKHDGSFKGVRYFETSHPTAGSFLRLEKCNAGVSYMEALFSRYGTHVGDDAATNNQDMFVCGRNQQTAVTTVGLDKISQKQGQFDELRAVGLRGMYVSHVGNADEVAVSSRNLTELDLSQNLLGSWNELAKITAHMPKLTSLNVSENRLRPPQPDDDTLDNCFDSVQSLFANRMAYDWTTIFDCVKLFPVLQNLHICFNRVSSIDGVLSLPCSSSLRLINLEGNPIDSWDNVIVLGELKQLETLILNDCLLSQIRFPGSCRTPTGLFPALRSLSICGNQLVDWSSFNEINRLPSLTGLRFTRNPLPVESNVLTARQIAVAKIARLQLCNGAAVTRVERHDAEVSYMLAYGAAWKAAEKAAGAESDKFAEAHPRYQDIARLYGAPEDAEIAPRATSALKNSLITVRIETKLTDRPPMVKELPLKMTVQRLKALVQRTFRVTDVSSLRLVHVSIRSGGSADKTEKEILNSTAETTGEKLESGRRLTVDRAAVAKVELDNDLRELSFYSLEDGAVILAEWSQ